MAENQINKQPIFKQVTVMLLMTAFCGITPPDTFQKQMLRR